jgi:hypothetical protein
MKTLKVIAGIVCILVAFFPAGLAFVMFSHAVVPRLTSPPTTKKPDTVSFEGRELRPWEIYAIPTASAMVALGLVGGGLFLLCPSGNDEH